MWRYIKIMVIVAIVGSLAKSAVGWRQEQRTDHDVPALVAKMQATLPRMVSDDIELQSVTYDNRTLHHLMVSKVWFDASPSDNGAARQALVDSYCAGGGSTFARMDIAVDYDIMVPPQTLSDRMTHVRFAIKPAECGRTGAT